MNAASTVAARSPPHGARVLIDGRGVLMLGSNNYLGLANHPAVVQAAVPATRTYERIPRAGHAHEWSDHLLRWSLIK